MATDDSEEPTETSKEKRTSARRTSTRKKTSPKEENQDTANDDEAHRAEKKPKAVAKKRKATPEGAINDVTVKAPTKKKAPAHQVLTERDEIPKLWHAEKAAENGSYSKSRQ